MRDGLAPLPAVLAAMGDEPERELDALFAVVRVDRNGNPSVYLGSRLELAAIAHGAHKPLSLSRRKERQVLGHAVERSSARSHRRASALALK